MNTLSEHSGMLLGLASFGWLNMAEITMCLESTMSDRHVLTARDFQRAIAA